MLRPAPVVLGSRFHLGSAGLRFLLVVLGHLSVPLVLLLVLVVVVLILRSTMCLVGVVGLPIIGHDQG